MRFFIIPKILIPLVGAAALFSCSPWEEKKPNVIFLLLDALRADRLGCYGYARSTSPVLDEMAEEGALFLNHFANGTYTLSSVPTYFYSRYFIKSLFPADRRIPLQSPDNLFRDLDEEAVSIGSIFKRNGYRTALFSAHPWFIRGYELVKDFDDFARVSGHRSAHGDARRVFSEMTDWIEKNDAGREPFFIYAHLMDTHFPHERKEESEKYLEPETDSPPRFDWRGYPRGQEIGAGGLWRLPEDFPEEDRKYLNALYDGDINYTDAQLGRFIQHLKEKNLYDNTLIIITSDHGEHLGQHDLTEHGGPPWDSVIRIPLILRLPKKIAAGTRILGLTENVDILPTIVGLLNLNVPAGKKFDGKDILGDPGSEAGTKQYVLTPDSIRTERYKYMVDRTDGSEYLYDLETDPEEKNNLIEKETQLARKLKEEMERLLADSKSRYERAVNDRPPELPFAISADYFRLDSASPIEVIKQYQYPSPAGEILPRARTNPVWFQNKIAGRYYVLGFNQPGLSPLAVSFPAPDGKYRVSVNCRSAQDVMGSPASVFKIALGEDEPGKALPVNTSDKPMRHQFSLGEVQVENNTFRAHIYPAADPSWIIVSYFGFEPVDSPAAAEEISGKAGDERLDSLKSLGYVQ